MGSSVSTQNKTENNDWDQFINRTENDRARAYQQEEVLGVFNGEKDAKNVQTTQKETYKVEINQIIEDNLKIDPDSQIPNTFHITMNIINKRPDVKYSVVIHYFSKDEFDSETAEFRGFSSFTNQPSSSFILLKGKETLTFTLALERFSLGIIKDDTGYFPFIVELVDQNGIRVLNYYNMNIQKEFIPELKKRVVVINGKYTVLKNVFGLKTSGLVTDKDKEDCLVCLTNSTNTIIVPCNHMCLCDECADDLKKTTKLCPLCRNVFTGFTKLIVHK